MSAASIATLDILIVAEDASTRATLVKALGAAGAAHLRAAESSAKAQAALRERAAELIVVEHAPGLDGLELVNALRADRRYARMFMVMVCGNGELKPDALNGGPDVVLARPLTASALLGAIETALLRH